MSISNLPLYIVVFQKNPQKTEAIAGHFGDLKVPRETDANTWESWGEKDAHGCLEGRKPFGPEHLCKYHVYLVYNYFYMILPTGLMEINGNESI